MEKNVMSYQKAFNSIVERLKSTEEVLAVMVFGSMVTGDLWEESDIDLFVVLDMELENIRNIYTEEKEIAVHIKLMSKEKFIQLYSEDLKGGFIHRIFASSRLVFSKDMDITSTYDNGRYYPDLDRERWTMVYLGSVLKRLGICKKYIHNDGLYTAYSAIVRSIEEYSKLYVNFSGYMISKDAMTMAMHLDDNYKIIVDKLFNHKEDLKTAIQDAVDFIEGAIDNDIKSMAAILMNFLRSSDISLSAEEVKNNKLFQNFDIEMEEILDKLWEKQVLKKDSRDYKSGENVLFNENVYYI